MSLINLIRLMLHQWIIDDEFLIGACQTHCDRTRVSESCDQRKLDKIFVTYFIWNIFSFWLVFIVDNDGLLYFPSRNTYCVLFSFYGDLCIFFKTVMHPQHFGDFLNVSLFPIFVVVKLKIKLKKKKYVLLSSKIVSKYTCTFFKFSFQLTHYCLRENQYLKWYFLLV